MLLSYITCIESWTMDKTKLNYCSHIPSMPYLLFSSLSLSVWTEESSCTMLNSTIIGEINCSYSCGTECWKSSRYPCLQVYVSLNSTGRILRLSHNEETQEANPEVYIKVLIMPKTQKIMATLSRADVASWKVLVESSEIILKADAFLKIRNKNFF